MITILNGKHDIMVTLENYVATTSSGEVFHIKSSSPVTKRWAVTMIGGARTYAFTRNSFLQNVVNLTYPLMDVFVSTISTYSCSVDSFSAVFLERDSTAWRYHHPEHTKEELGATDYKALTYDRFYTEQMGLLELIDDHTKENNFTYDYIFYTRPDIFYTIPLNIKKLERTLDKNNGTIFIPQCCTYNDGWCDRVAAA